MLQIRIEVRLYSAIIEHWYEICIKPFETFYLTYEIELWKWSLTYLQNNQLYDVTCASSIGKYCWYSIGKYCWYKGKNWKIYKKRGTYPMVNIALLNIKFIFLCIVISTTVLGFSYDEIMMIMMKVWIDFDNYTEKNTCMSQILNNRFMKGSKQKGLKTNKVTDLMFQKSQIAICIKPSASNH